MEAKSTGTILATLTALQRDFPAWAMWRDGAGRWVATRPPGPYEPSPGSYLLWVYGDTADELVTRMRKGEAMSDDEWGRADRAIERLRAVLARACGVPANAISWSYGGVSGERSTTRVTVRLDVPQTDDLATLVARNIRPPT